MFTILYPLDKYHKSLSIAGYVSVCVQLYYMLVSTVLHLVVTVFHYMFRPTCHLQECRIFLVVTVFHYMFRPTCHLQVCRIFLVVTVFHYMFRPTCHLQVCRIFLVVTVFHYMFRPTCHLQVCRIFLLPYSWKNLNDKKRHADKHTQKKQQN
jgi:hypothetical protein